jgi:hypothetical protein
MAKPLQIANTNTQKVLLIDTTGEPYAATGVASGPAVTLADGADAAQGTTTDAAVTNPATAGTVISFLKGLITLLAAMSAKLPASLGNKVNAAALATTVTNVSAVGYETVAASQTAQVLGGAGALGDFLSGLLVTPSSLDAGQVLLLDNATSITVFAGGTGSVTTLITFFIPIGANSVSGAWKVTTGANVSVMAIGNFT